MGDLWALEYRDIVIFSRETQFKMHISNAMESFFENFYSVMSYASWPIFRLFWNMSHALVNHT